MPSGQAAYAHWQQPCAQWLCSITKQKGGDYIKENTMVNNKIEGKSTGGKATKPIQETLMLSWSSPLPSNHSPSACRGFWGTLSTLHGQADPS